MDPRVLAAAVGAFGVALAGCLQGAEPVGGSHRPLPFAGLSFEDLVPEVFEWEHEHTDAAEHRLAWNAELLAHLAPEAAGHDNVVHGELDLAGDVAFAGVGHGFMVYGVRDPSRPAFLHYEPAPADAGCVGDVKAGPAEGLLVLATQCAQPGQAQRGFVVYDVADPAAPRVLSKAPPGTACHMADVSLVGGERYVYCADRTGASVWRLVDLPGAPATPVLVNPNFVREPEAAQHAPLAMAEFGVAAPRFLLGAHDMATQPDPLSGEPIVVVSHSYAGVRILDGSRPEEGRVLGAWAGDGASRYSWIHTAQAFEREGRRIVVAVTENVVESPPRLWVLDFSDYAAPRVVAEYALAGQDNSHGLTWSLHNFQVVGTRLYIGVYHAGFWVLDLTDLAAPRPVAFALPAGESPYKPNVGTFFGIGNDWVTQVWDVVVKDGYVLASDMRSGFYVYQVGGDPAGDAGYRSFG